MEVPLIIENYGSELIHNTDNRTVADILTVLDPSVTSASFGGGFDNFRLRGFAGDLFNTFRSDGLALAPHQDMPMELVERVDVLKGPTGFLYGINSPGGTINYIPKRPTQTPFTRVNIQGSSLSNRYIAVDNSASFADGSIGYRLNAGFSKTGNFDHFGDFERKFIGITTDIRVAEAALLQINTNWTNTESMADPLLRAEQIPGENYVLPPQVNRRHALSPSWFLHAIEASNIDTKLTYTLNEDWAITGQWIFSRVKHDAAYNDLFAIQPNGDIGEAWLAIRRNSRYDTWTGQSYLSGRFETGNVLHEVFIGASQHMNHDASPIWNEDGGDTPGEVADASVGNILHPVQPARIYYGAINPLEYNSNIQETAVFASDLISLSAQFQIMAGARYLQFEARNHFKDAPAESKNSFIPTAALIWRPNNDWMGYINYSQGLERGEYAPYYANNANQSSKSVESSQIEIGLKAQLGTDSRIGLAVFDLRRDANYVNTANDFVSGGEYTHKGVELTGSTRLFQDLKLAGHVAYLATELKDVDDPATLGKRSTGVPRWKAAMQTTYDLTLVPGLSMEASISYMGSRAIDAQNEGFMPSYTLLNAGLRYTTNRATLPVTFRLHGRNLTDKYYYPGVNGGGLQIGRGREVFFSAQVAF